jgi:hypothetical protein
MQHITVPYLGLKEAMWSIGLQCDCCCAASLRQSLRVDVVDTMLLMTQHFAVPYVLDLAGSMKQAGKSFSG